MVVLGGVTLLAFPDYAIGFIGVAVASIVALVAQKMPYSSLMNILIGYTVIIALSARFSPEDLNSALALGGLAVIVFGHAILGHARRRRSEVAADLASR